MKWLQMIYLIHDFFLIFFLHVIKVVTCDKSLWVYYNMESSAAQWVYVWNILGERINILYVFIEIITLKWPLLFSLHPPIKAVC